MPESYYRTGQVAKQVGASAHHIRRLCEGGMIEADLSDGNQWRIPASEVGRLLEEGLPPIPLVSKSLPSEINDFSVDPPIPSTKSQVCHSPHVQVANDELIITETRLKKRKLEREQEEVEDFFRAREQKSASEKAAQIQEQQNILAETLRRQWVESWQSYAFRSLPEDAPPEFKLALRRDLMAIFTTLDVQTSQIIVRDLVDAAIRKTIEPHLRQKEWSRIVEDAVMTLPRGARGWPNPTSWEIRARQAAIEEMAKMSSDASPPVLRMVATTAVEQIGIEFQDDVLRRSIRTGVGFWRLGEANELERQAAQNAVEAVLARCPIGTNWERLENAANSALDIVGQQVSARRAGELKTKRAEATADARLAHVESYLSTNYEFDDPFELMTTARALRADIRADLVSELCSESLDASEIQAWIEAQVDDFLDS